MSAEAGETSEFQLMWAKWGAVLEGGVGPGRPLVAGWGKGSQGTDYLHLKGPMLMYLLHTRFSLLHLPSPPTSLTPAPTYGFILPTISLRLSPRPPCSMGIFWE